MTKVIARKYYTNPEGNQHFEIILRRSGFSDVELGTASKVYGLRGFSGVDCNSCLTFSQTMRGLKSQYPIPTRTEDRK